MPLADADVAQVRTALREAVATCEDHVEVRYHRKHVRSVTIDGERIDNLSSRTCNGTGVRVLAGGSFGFAACPSFAPEDVKFAIQEARSAALCGATRRQRRVSRLARASLAVGSFELPGFRESKARSFDEMMAIARETVRSTRGASRRLCGAYCNYSEAVEQRVIVTSDGADCSIAWARPEIWAAAVAEGRGVRVLARRSLIATGGLGALFRAHTVPSLSAWVAETAVDQLEAKHPDAGRYTVIMAPSLVGLLVHEAVGHCVEADFVQAGSVAAGKLGQRVASELVSLYDSGSSEHVDGAAGTLPVDDEGVLSQRAVLIDKGILSGYLHNRESAAHFDMPATGSARAWEYGDHPLIRMRNTYLAPGASTLDDMIAGVDDGFLLDGPREGRADANGQFVFSVERAQRIRRGKLGEIVRGVTVSGLGFEVLKSVDALSSDFGWALGAGGCEKGQPANVDAGGPYMRCHVLIGGDQSFDANST